MNLVQMIDSFKVGGAEKLQLTFAEAIRSQNVKLTVLCLRNQYDPMRAELEALGARVVVIEGASLLDPRRLRHLIRFFKEYPQDVIHAHLTTANILGTWVGRWLGLPSIATLHSTSLETGLRGRMELLTMHHLTDKVVAVGHSVKDAYQEAVPASKLTVLPNAVKLLPQLSLAERTSVRHEVTGDPNRCILIAVGRLVAAKGYEDLITAFAQVQQSFKNATLLIVGDGPMRVVMEAKIREHGMEDHIRLLGQRSDVPRLLAAADVFVSSSHWEGLPVSILEAMSAGLPIVATSVGDIPHVLRDGLGIVVPTKQPDELAMALCAMLGDHQKRVRMGQAAREHVQLHYSTDRWIQRWMELYDEVRQ